MQAFSPDDRSVAADYYRSIPDGDARRLFDFLVDHPDVQRTAGELQRELGFAAHADVARATFLLGNLAAALGRSRPWGEGQMGYQMSEALAKLFREARASS